MQDEAILLIKELLLKRKLNNVKLAKLMREKGYKETQDTIRSKIHRGSYNIRFLLAVCDTLDLEIRFTEKT